MAEFLATNNFPAGSTVTGRILNGSVFALEVYDYAGGGASAGSESFNKVKSGTTWIDEPEYRNVIPSGTTGIIGSVAVTTNPVNITPSGDFVVISSGNNIIGRLLGSVTIMGTNNSPFQQAGGTIKGMFVHIDDGGGNTSSVASQAGTQSPRGLPVMFRYYSGAGLMYTPYASPSGVTTTQLYARASGTTPWSSEGLVELMAESGVTTAPRRLMVLSEIVSSAGSIGVFPTSVGSVLMLGYDSSANLDSPLIANGSYLMVAGSISSMPSVSATSSTDYKISGTHTGIGSASLIAGDYGGSVWPIRIEGGSYIMIAGSISSMPPVTASSSSDYKVSGTWVGIGSASLVAGDFNGSVYPLHLETGSSLLIIGSVRQSIIPWVVSGTSTVSGSIYVTGSINQLTDPWRITGSVTPYGVGSSLLVSSAGSVGIYITAGSVNQNTDPWRITGSVISYGVGSIRIAEQGVIPLNVTGSVQPYNPIGVGSVLVISSTGSIRVTATKGDWSHGVVNVGSPASLITLVASTDKMVEIFNAGSNSIYIGSGANVDQTNGFAIPANTDWWDEFVLGSVYGVGSGASDNNVRWRIVK